MKTDDALDVVTDGVVRFDAEYRFRYINPAAARILGRPRDVLLGKSFRLEFPELESTSLLETCVRSVSSRTEARSEGRFESLAARLEVRAFPSDDGVLLLLRETTERAELRDHVEHAEAELKIVSDTVPAFLAYVDRNETYRFVNRTVEAWFGIPNDALIGLHVSAMLGDSDFAVLRALIARAFAGEPVHSRALITFPAGPRWVDLSVVPHVQDHVVDGAMLMALDVTARHRAEEEAREARQVAEESSRVKDEFLAMVSHELRTPLNAILGWTSLMTSGVLTADRYAHGLTVIDRNARAQAALVEELLDISRIITGKLRVEMKGVSIREIIASAVDALRPAAESKGIRLEQKLDPAAEGIMGDADRLQQIVFNLLTNAVRHTPGGGEVKVTTRLLEPGVEIRVDDTGEGIPPELTPHVFDRFRQGDGGTTRRYGGLGLGLAIVKHVVELHGGTIDVTSEGVGRGASFVIRIPTAGLRPLQHANAAGKATRPSIVGSSPSAVDLAGLLVLVVDDDDDTREVLKVRLESAGARVVTASSAAEGFAAFCKERPGVLLSDIGMPLEDGYAFIERIRALPTTAGGNTPAIALTAFARLEDRARALGAGFTGHLVKPVDGNELVAVVATVAVNQNVPA